MYKIVCEKKNRLTFTRKIMGFESWTFLDLGKFWTKKIIQNVKCLESFKKSSKSKKIKLLKPLTIFV